ncbi:MAG: ATP-binding cassette domain-containing protein, partial [Sphingomonadales bacterium]
MEGASLLARDLACRRGDRLLFAGVSFTLDPGEALQVVGANGTGKSSLLRILAGLLRPFAGAVEKTGPVALLDGNLPLDGHLPLGRALAFWE